MYTAMLTLENMQGAKHDVWAVNTDFEYHEEQKLEKDGGGDGPTTAGVAGGAVPSGQEGEKARASR